MTKKDIDQIENRLVPAMDKMIDQKISKTIAKAFDIFFIKMLEVFPTRSEVSDMIDNKLEPIKEDINVIKDDIISIKNTLNHEVEISNYRLDQHDIMLKDHDERISDLE